MVTIKDVFICMILVCLLELMPWAASLHAQTILQKGQKREEAAALNLEKSNELFESETRAIAFALMEPDTASVEGQIIEVEKKKRSLANEIAMFVIVSAFVGYFIAKVFLEKDTESPSPEPEKKGKKFPTVAGAVPSR